MSSSKEMIISISGRRYLMEVNPNVFEQWKIRDLSRRIAEDTGMDYKDATEAVLARYISVFEDQV